MREGWQETERLIRPLRFFVSKYVIAKFAVLITGSDFPATIRLPESFGRSKMPVMELKLIRIIFLISGTGLLLVNLIGTFFFKPLQPPDEGIPGYDYPLRDAPELEEIAVSPPEIGTIADLEEINEIVFERIFHTDKRKYSFTENYLLYLGGFFHEYISSPQNPKAIIKGGGGLCNEISAVLRHILRKAGVPARYIGLQGHVALEVKIEDEWVVADPDYGVVYAYSLAELEESGDEIIPGVLEEAGYPDEMIEQVVEVFLDSDENVILPAGRELSLRLSLIEKTAGYLKWLIPAGLLFLGIAGAARKKV